MNNKIKSLQQKLNDNMDKAVKLAENNTIRNENGEVVFSKDEIDDMEDMEDIDIISDNVKQSLKEQLKYALIKFSYGKVNEIKAEEISKKVIDKIDLTNSAFNHKGMNWCAKEILNMMGIKNNKYQTLNQIRENNRTDTTLLASEILPQEYSDELVEQYNEEFNEFVKPIRDEVVSRYIDKCTKKYNKALKNLADEYNNNKLI